jgi:thiamine biosynthesis lipoprotein
MTAGTVDPTVGEAVSSLGYDRDFDLISSTARQELREPVPAPGWWRIELDPEQLTVLVPPGTSIDLGSSAKAFAADRAAEIISDRLGCGVLVNLGGDVAVSGNPPAGGWAVGIAQSCAAEPKSADQVVSIARGGLASSGISNRSWKRGGRKLHHIVDPATGDCAEEVWSLVSVAAPTCVEANAFSTASVVWGEDAPGILSSRGITARLVRPTGEVVSTGGWPEEGP